MRAILEMSQSRGRPGLKPGGVSGDWVDTMAGGGRHFLSKAYAGLGAGAGVCLGLSSKPKGVRASWRPPYSQNLKWGITIVLKEY